MFYSLTVVVFLLGRGRVVASLLMFAMLRMTVVVGVGDSISFGSG